MTRQVSPIASFIRKHTHLLLLLFIVGAAAFFRFYQLGALPPGLHPDEARVGLEALQLLKGNFQAVYNAGGITEIVFVLFQLVFIKLFGNSVAALQIAPALLGIAATLTTYLWMRTWFGKRAGLIAAFLMAVTPWSVSLTRVGFRAAIAPLFISLLLWVFTRGFQTGGRRWFIAAGLILGIGFYSCPITGPLFAALLFIAAIVYFKRRKFFKQWAPKVTSSLLIALCMLIPLILYTATHMTKVKNSYLAGSIFDRDATAGKPLDATLKSAASTALMFNVHGDESYLYNYDAQPALNVFVGIMFILGILLCLSSLGRPKYLAMLVLLLAGLIPVFLNASNSPNFARSIAALPLAIGLATIGIGYMLERWYATFPINSAARASGLGIILLLLLLTGFQGFTQYFVSWANDSKTYSLYNEDTTGMAKFLLSKPFNGQRFVLLDTRQDLIAAYLTANHKSASYQRIEPAAINGLPLDGKPKQFLISGLYKDAAIHAFKLKFPGGRLSPYDGFDQTELYLVYEVTK